MLESLILKEFENGSATNERMIKTNSRIGKKDFAKSTKKGSSPLICLGLPRLKRL